MYKKTISAILSACLLHFTIHATETNKVSYVEKTPLMETNDIHKDGAPILFFVVVCTVVASVAVIYIYSKNDTYRNDEVTFVLEKSYDNDTWTPVHTNLVKLDGDRPIEAFREQMTDSVAFYRARRQQK